MPPLTALCFRQVVYLLVFLGILTVTTTATAANREVRRYDRQGRYQGKAVSNGRVSYYRLSRQRIEEFKFGSAQFSACFQVCLFKNSFEVDLSRSHVTK